jgi:integrase/recombinase XerD
MTSSTPSVSPLRQRMLDDMRMRKLSPDTASVEDLRLYQLYLVDHGTSAVSINNALSGLKFLFEHTLDHPELMRKMQSVRVPHKLPVVLSRDEVARLLAACGNLKHQTALSVAYGAGLRVNEVCSLKISDVDSQRMALRIEQGKGSKDRYAMLSPVLLERLRVWVAACPCTGQDARRWVVVPRTRSH